MSKSKGTFQWMVPEVISYTNYTQMADVYSFGIIMHEIYSRTPPYSGVGKVVVSKKIAKDPNYRPPIDKNIPNDWKEIIKKCWDFDPQKRPTFQIN